MSRTRVKRPKSSTYITADGAKRLSKELEDLWRVERPRVTQQVSEAAALGDRSENADYIYGKRRLRQIDSRVRFLTKRLEELTVVEPREDGVEIVYFGAWVLVADEDGTEVEYRVVGPDESDAASNAISMDSPMGKALLGKSVGDEVIVQRPKGRGVFEVLAVRYR